MTIVDGAFGGGLGGILGGGFGGQQSPASFQQQLMSQQALSGQMFAQLQAQQQFNLAGTSMNGLSDLMRGQRPFPFCNCPDEVEPEPEPPRYRSRAWGVFVVRW